MTETPDMHPTAPVPSDQQGAQPAAADPAATTGTGPTYSTPTAQIPLPPQNPWAPPAPATPAASPRRPALGVVLATSLLAGTLGAGLGAAAVIATDDGLSTSTSTTTTGDVGDISAAVLPDGSVARVANDVLPSVVSIQFTGDQGGGSGSGVVIDDSGLILTNNHVVEGAADGGSLTVAFQDGTSTSAEIVGRDPSSDLAVIRVDGAEGLKAVALGSSDSLRVGETVVAIGSPLGLSGTVTTGIVSAKNRPVLPGDAAGDQSVLNAIQTDAAINPGNSGGALVNLEGELVGVNSAIATLGASPGSQAGSIGLGFAIPIDQAKWISDQLIENGSVQHARLGVSVESAAGDVRGAVVKTVEPGSTADDLGIEVDDVITGFDTQGIDSADALVAAVRSAEPGTTVTVTLVRGGDTKSLDVTLAAEQTS
ncbi:MAG TPA: trypsin-like peptidase domain-containing protein [Actinomycetes bacterium]|nr:trypsin-like peptidase domain-containing protein [Actinomycetes bacterium]